MSKRSSILFRGFYGIFPILFAFLIMVGNLRYSSMYLYYAVAQEDFIERLCENKDKPELHCDGKCALAKMLQKQTDKNETPLPDIVWEQLVFVYDFQDFDPIGSVALRSTFFIFDFYKSPYQDTDIPPPLA